MKILKLICNLSEIELDRLDLFLDSAYHNGEQELLNIFKHLRSIAGRTQVPSIEQLCRSVFPDQRPTVNRFRQKLTKLYQLIERFLVYEHLERQPILLDRFKQRALLDIGSFAEFSRHSTRTILRLEQYTTLGIFESQQLFELCNCYYEYPGPTEGQLPDQLPDRVLLYADINYVLIKLRYACDALDAQLTYNRAESIDYLEEVAALAEKLAQTHPLIDIYLTIYQALTTPVSGIRFLQIKEKFDVIHDRIALDELHFLLLKIINYGLYVALRIDDSYATQLMALYKVGVAKKIFTRYRVMSGRTFLNICNIGAHTGQIEWTLQFIERYKKYLNKIELDAASGLGESYCLFKLKKFQKASRLCFSIKPNSLHYKISLQSQGIRCLVESYLSDPNYGPVLQARLRSLKSFLRRNQKMAADRKMAYLNFCQIIDSMLALGEKKVSGRVDQETLNALDDDLQKLNPVVSKRWLVDALNRL